MAVVFQQIQVKKKQLKKIENIKQIRQSEKPRL